MTEESEIKVGNGDSNKWKDIWLQFRKHKGALIGSVIFSLIFMAVMFGPIFCPFEANEINIEHIMEELNKRKK